MAQYAVSAIVVFLLCAVWLKFVHDPRVRQEALDIARVDSITEVNERMKIVVEQRDLQIDSLRIASRVLSDDLSLMRESAAQAYIVRERRTEETDSIVQSVIESGSTDLETLRRVHLVFKEERAAWEREVSSLKATIVATDKLLENLRQRERLLSQNVSALKVGLEQMTTNWSAAEEMYRQAKNPGLIKRIEIAAPIAAAVGVVGLVVGLLAN